MTFAEFLPHLLLAALALVFASRRNELALFIRLRPTTHIAVRGFFLATAVEQTAISVSSGPELLAGAAFVQLLCLVAMAVSLSLDARRAVVRFSNALSEITERYDGLAVVRGKRRRALIASGDAEELHVGSTVIAAINHALQE